MELDDLKEKWKSSNFNNSKLDVIDFNKVSKSIEKLRKGIRMILIIELCIAFFIYLGFLLAVLWGGDVKPFLYKLVIISAIGIIPIGYRLYKAQQMIYAIDYSRDIKSNLIDFLVYYKTTLNLYKWGSHALLVLLLLVFFADQSFTELSLKLQFSIAAYIFLVMLLIGPYIRKVYGSKIRSIEAFLKD